METTRTEWILLFICLHVTSGIGETIEEIQKDYWNWRMENEPEYSTYLGIYAYNDRVTSFNMSQFEVRKNKTSDFLNRLNTIDQSGLTDAARINYLILKDTFETYIEGYKWAWYGAINPMNFLEGIQIYYSASMAATRTRGDFENYIARIQGVVKQLAEIKETFREAIRMNRTYHKVSIAAVPSQIEKLLVNNTEDSVFYSPFNKSLEDAENIEDVHKIDIRQRGKDSINTMLNAYRDIRNFILQEYMASTRSAFGVNSLENGGAYYQACLDWHLSFKMTPDDVHKTGIQEVDRIYGEMQKTMEKLGFGGTVKEFFSSLVDDPRFFSNDTDKIIEEYKHIFFERINPKLKDFFKDIPDVPLEIRKMSYDGPGGGYSSASENSPGVFRINLFRPMENPWFDFMALSLHEANPGHHLQISSIQNPWLNVFYKEWRRVMDDAWVLFKITGHHSYAMKASLPDYRRHTPISFYDVPFWFPFYSAYSEGWALYSEYLGEEMGLYKDEYELMGRYSAEMLRACRLVVDTGLHYFNWDKEQAIDYMLNYTAYSREATEIEINRYITWPGQACAYKLGEIRIRDLRREAENELGNKFDVRDFHSVILTNGAMPISVLESLIKEWISKKKLEQTSSGVQKSFMSLNVLIMSLLIFIGSVFVL